MIANPVDLARYGLAPLDVAAERSLLTTALGDLVPQHFDLEHLDAPATLERLESALTTDPHVLHFVGHGTFSAKRQQAALYLQDAAGNTQIVTEAQLVALLRRQATPPRLIVLAACQSAERSTANAFAGLAPKLVQAGVPAVVAMQDKAAISAVRRLTTAFYEALLRCGEVDRALNAARSLLLAGQAPDAGVPVLLMRLRNGRLWNPVWVKTNPYRGLAAFTENDADFFCGREQLIADLKNHLRRHPRFLAVVGPSGSGKSSVVQAGLLPALRRGDLPRSEEWQIVSTRPGDDPYTAIDLPGFLSPERSRQHRLVLFIDQFEELFALCPPEVQTRFLNDLHALITGAVPATVILTLRADFYGHVLRHPLGERLAESQVNVLPMQPEALRAAVETPAHQVGLDFEAGLVESIVEDAREADHALPLLQSALAQLWRRQDHGTLTYAAYQDVGRVAGALGLWAEDAYAVLSAEEQRLARRIFTRLVHFSAGEGADTRQRRKLDELAARPEEREFVHRLVRRLADARLLVTDEIEGEETVEIIHDALLTEWGRLRDWLTEQREFYLWRQRLDAQMQTWQTQGQDSSALLRGKLLDEAERWLEQRPDDLNTEERAYIRASVLRRRHQRVVLSSTLGALIVVVLSTIFGIQQRDLQINERARATEQAALSAAQDSLATATVALGEAETERQRANQERDIAQAAQLATARQARISRSQELAARAQSINDPTGSLNLMLAREAALTTWITDTDVITRSFVTNETLAALNDAVFNARQLPWRMTLPSARHAGDVWAVAYSPDGSRIVSGSSDHTLRVWDAQTGETLHTLSGHTDWVRAVAYSPDGTRIVSGGDDQTVRVWDAASGQEVQQLSGHSGIVNAVAYSPDGTRIVSGSSDQTVRVWDAASGQEVQQLSGHSGPVNAVAYSSDGTWIVSVGLDQTVRVWDAASGREVQQLSGHSGPVNAVAYSSDGTWIFSGSSDQTVRVWDAESGQEVQRLTGHSGAVLSVAYSPDGTRIVSGGLDQTVRVWDAASGQEVQQLSGHSGPVNAVAYSPGGTRIVSGSSDQTVRVWDAASGQEVQQLTGHSGLVNAVAYAVAYSPDGMRIVSGSRDGTLRVWDAASGQEVQQLTGHLGAVRAVAYSPDGTRIVSGSRDGTLRVWDAQTGAEVLKVTGHTDDVNAVAYSPDGTRIISGSLDETVRVWDATSGQEVHTLTGHSGAVLSVAYSPDGTRIVSGSDDQTVRVWNAESGREVQQLTGHTGWVRVVAYSPDGTRIVSGSDDGTVRVWDAASGQEVQQLTGHSGAVLSVAYSPDGTRIVSGGWDQTVRQWYVDVEYLLDLADSLIQRVPPIFVGDERTLYGFDEWPAREH